jgi:antibiotic biosynthesis monooxygenase (ABM) superfamily enzyme
VIANTPEPPYTAVIFTSLRTNGDNGYGTMAERMEELAAQQPGYLGIESARDGIGITVSYYERMPMPSVSNMVLDVGTSLASHTR